MKTVVLTVDIEGLPVAACQNAIALYCAHQLTGAIKSGYGHQAEVSVQAKTIYSLSAGTIPAVKTGDKKHANN